MSAQAPLKERIEDESVKGSGSKESTNGPAKDESAKGAGKDESDKGRPQAVPPTLFAVPPTLFHWMGLSVL